MSKSKWARWLIIVCIVLIAVVSSGWIIRPTAIALVQRDDWVGVCKGVIALHSNGDSVVQMKDNPLSYLETKDGMLEIYLKQKGYNVTYYYPEFMVCEYIDEEGSIIQLDGRKCGIYDMEM